MSMNYEVTNGNVKKIYSVHFDNEKLEDVLNGVCREACYKVKDERLEMPSGAKWKENKIIDGAKLPNGDPMFININSIYEYTSNGGYSYPNDSLGIDGTKLIVPKLAYILADLIDNKEGSLKEFLDYEHSPELISIDKKISILSARIDNVNNENYNRKIELLEQMKELCENKKNNHFFNASLLAIYYEEACSIIELHLEKEIITQRITDEKIKIKDFLEKK